MPKSGPVYPFGSLYICVAVPYALATAGMAMLLCFMTFTQLYDLCSMLSASQGIPTVRLRLRGSCCYAQDGTLLNSQAVVQKVAQQSARRGMFSGRRHLPAPASPAVHPSPTGSATVAAC